MFASATTPSDSYKQVGVETGVMAASPHKLILMLFEGALLSLSVAGEALAQKDVAAKGKAISKAIEILTNGLKASLDFEQGGELAERLAALYDYMTDRLLYANLHNDAAALAEVQGLLKEIKGAWEEIANDPAVVSASQGQA
ncbi:MAG: flagellar export chaperone FliS [Rhodocyclaceae bacterium]|nr:flagellar export chaperone FliS [Rhodocyclaceae bacterium]